MAPTINQDLQVSWNPLACSDTAMRPNTLLMAKLTFLLLLVSGFPQQILLAALIPWWAGGEILVHLNGLRPALAVVFFAAGTLLLLNRFVRHASLAAGVVVFAVLLLSRSAFHAGTVLSGFILLWGGFQGRRDHPSFVQWQIVIAHFALFLGATNGLDWLGALTAEPWIPEDVGNPLLQSVQQVFPSGWFDLSLGGLVLVTELLLTVGLALRPLRRPAIVGSLAFHTALYGLMGSREIAVLVAAMAIGMLAFVHWPQTTLTAIWPRACGWPVWLRMTLERTDWDQRIDWPMPRDPEGELEVSHDGVATRGWSGVGTLLLFQPALHFGFLLLAATLALALPLALRAPVNATLALGCLLFFVWPDLRRFRLRRPSAGDEPQTAAP